MIRRSVIIAATNTERVSPVQAARMIDELMALLGLDSIQFARFLRNPGSDYPSDGLVRTMRLGKQLPSAKFSELLTTRYREVQEQLRVGVQAIELDGEVLGVYQVTPKRHLVTIIDRKTLQRMGERSPDVNSLPVMLSACLDVPDGWIQECEICRRPYLARTSRSRFCYRTDDKGIMVCRREARKRWRATRKGAAE